MWVIGLAVGCAASGKGDPGGASEDGLCLAGPAQCERQKQADQAFYDALDQAAHDVLDDQERFYVHLQTDPAAMASYTDGAIETAAVTVAALRGLELLGEPSNISIEAGLSGLAA